MRTPPSDINVGDRYKQDDIEESFDTGFGYQISGINPRRDSQDRRYVLLFANEDGPYDDSVHRGGSSTLEKVSREIRVNLLRETPS